MQLLYLWIEDEIVIQNNGFNFSSKYKFDIEVNRDTMSAKVSVEQNHSHIEKLFGENIPDLTAIVGANGVGKSTLLDFVIRLLSNNTYLGEKYLVIFLDETHQSMITYHTLYKLSNTAQIDKVWKVAIEGENLDLKLAEPRYQQIYYGQKNYPNDWSLSFLKTTKSIFYSPAFDLRNYPDKVKNSKNYEDVSTNYLLYADSEADYEKNFDQVEHHRFQNTLRQFQLAQSNLSDLRELNIPKEIQIVFTKTNKVDKSDLGIETASVYEYLRKQGSSNGQKCNTLIENAQKTKSRVQIQKAKLEKVKSWFLVNLLDNFFDNLSEYKDLQDKMFYVSLEEVKSDDFTQSIRALFSKQTWIEESQFSFNQFINLVFTKVDKAILKLEIPDNDASFYLPVSEAEDIYKWHYKYRQIFSGLRSSTFRRGFMELNWRDLSTGEKARLDLYARIFFAYRRITDQFLPEPEFHDDIDNSTPTEVTFIYLLLDEAELGFHPSWQRKFISSLTTFLSKLTDTKIQVILTSHSPFVLSDLPKNNIIFLQKSVTGFTEVLKSDTKSETFAANIHELFSDSFFMGEGLIGEFALQFINSLLIELTKRDAPSVGVKALLESKIGMIGEPLVRARLLEMLNEITTLETDEEEISRLEKELSEAKKRVQQK
jgi:predicted ATPase